MYTFNFFTFSANDGFQKEGSFASAIGWQEPDYNGKRLFLLPKEKTFDDEGNLIGFQEATKVWPCIVPYQRPSKKRIEMLLRQQPSRCIATLDTASVST